MSLKIISIKSLSIKNFFKTVRQNIKLIHQKIDKISKTDSIYGFGASTKGNVTLQLCKLNGESIKGIFDINKEKFNKFTPGSNIKIIDEKKIMYKKPKYLLLLIWHFKKTIKNKLKRFNLKKTKLIWLFPKIKITKHF